MKFLSKFSLKTIQTSLSLIQQLLLTAQNKQILQKLRQVNDQIQLHDIFDPTNQKYSD